MPWAMSCSTRAWPARRAGLSVTDANLAPPQPMPAGQAGRRHEDQALGDLLGSAEDVTGDAADLSPAQPPDCQRCNRGRDRQRKNPPSRGERGHADTAEDTPER